MIERFFIILVYKTSCRSRTLIYIFCIKNATKCLMHEVKERCSEIKESVGIDTLDKYSKMVFYISKFSLKITHV
jgi:hypothetical protein